MKPFELETLVTGRDAEDVAKKLAPVLREALGAMLKRPEGLGPFLVVEDVRTAKFVQWCGSREKLLRFEAPAIGLVRARVDGDLDAQVRLAIETLVVEPLYRVLFEEGARVTESDTYAALVTVERKR